MSHDILALNNYRNHIPLNHSWVLILEIRTRLCQRFVQEKIVECCQVLLVIMQHFSLLEATYRSLTLGLLNRKGLGNLQAGSFHFLDNSLFDT